MSLGAEFSAPVNTTIRNAQFASANASSANGSSVAVWVDTFSATDHDIRAQRFNAAGQKAGPEILVSGSPDNEFSPAVAMDAHGDFVVTWTQVQPGGDTNVIARRFNASGVPQGGIVPVGVGTFFEFAPKVAMDAQGDFVVAYTRDTNNNNPDVFAKRYDVNNHLTAVINVAVTPATEDDASIAMTPDGRFDIAWDQVDGLNNRDVFLKQFGASGALQSTLTIADNLADESVPSVAMDNAGNAVVAWQSTFNGHSVILAERVSASGSVGNEIPVATTFLNQQNPSVALRRNGGAFVVAYDAQTPLGPAVGVAEVSASGNVKTFTVSGRTQPAVSINGTDAYLLTYTSNDAGDLNIRRRIGHL